jgi:hypothetical protein
MATFAALAKIDPNDDTALAELSSQYWLDQLQPLRGLENVLPETVTELRSQIVVEVDILVIETNLDCGCSEETSPILVLQTGGSIDGSTLLEAAWAAYMLSLKATMDGGKNDRAHVGRDADAIELATSIVARLGGYATPCDEIYGSDGTYLEAIALEYDAETRTLTANPSIGS